MGEAKMGSLLKETLKTLCCGNGWSYGVFWRFDQRNSMLLTMEDAYYEAQMGAVVENMLLQVHMLGEGIVGQVASTGNHRWIYSDANNEGWDSSGSIENQDMFQDDSEICHQFSSGIKTVAVISVESRGVIQFGSTQKILEKLEFLDQIKVFLREMENIYGLNWLANPPPSVNCEGYDLDDWFGSLCNGNITPMPGGSYNELMEMAYTSINLTQSSALTSDVQQERVRPLCLESAYPTNQLQISGTEPQVILSSNPNYLSQLMCSQSASSINDLAEKIPYISAWNDEGSFLTSLESQLPSEKMVQDSPNVFSASANTPVSCGDVKLSCQGDSAYTSLYKTGGLDESEKQSVLSINATEGECLEKVTSLHRLPEEFKPDDFTTDLSNSCVVDNLFEWFASSPEHGIGGMATIKNENLSQPVGIIPASFGLVGDVSHDIPLKNPANSVQSCITDTYLCGEQQKSVTGGSSEHDLFEGLGLELCEQVGDCWVDMMMPVLNGHLNNSTCVSECISELDVVSTVGSRKGLFSELGLEQLLGSINNSTESSISDQSSATKKRKIEISSVNNNNNNNQVKLAHISFSAGNMMMQPAYNLDKTINPVPKKEVFPKSQVGLWIDDSYSVTTGSVVQAKPKKPEEPTKATRKRARPGESTRPRPKDRQQIQDRIQELRGIIPDVGKCSIDSLLDRTIKHMLFLQSVTKYADKLKQTDEPKLISKDNRMVLRDNSTSGGGATWALEVGDQTMACPIIVEDLSSPGLMLIEMLCDDRGFFLEIADVIRGFGLNILKGVMEVREEKIWARFIVEANAHITRVDIFLSLLELLHQTATSGMDSMNQPSNIMNSRIPLLNNYQQPALPCAVSLADTL